jgi:hypothetical protein
LSAGAICAVWPIIAQPVALSAAFISSSVRPTRNPGIASSLSSVPPVCPRPAARHHRHDQAAGGGERRENQRRLVTDAAGAVLVDFHTRDVAQVDANARVDHRIGEPRGFGGAHSPQKNRHQQRGRLVVGQAPRGDALDDELNLLARQRSAIPLLHDHFDCAHEPRQYTRLRSTVSEASYGVASWTDLAPINRTVSVKTTSPGVQDPAAVDGTAHGCNGSAESRGVLAFSDVRDRALEVEEASDDPPERIAAWLETVSTTSLGALDVALLLDLLRIDHDPVRWGTLMTPVVRLLDDLLLVGDFEAARQLVTVLASEASNEGSERRRMRWMPSTS